MRDKLGCEGGHGAGGSSWRPSPHSGCDWGPFDSRRAHPLAINVLIKQSPRGCAVLFIVSKHVLVQCSNGIATATCDVRNMVSRARVSDLLQRRNLKCPEAQPVSFARKHLRDIQRTEYV